MSLPASVQYTDPIPNPPAVHLGGYTPDPPGDRFKGEDDAWQQQVQHYYQVARDARRYVQLNWTLDSLFLKGGRGQYHYRDRNSQRVLYNEDGEEKRVTINRLPAIKEGVVAKFVRNKPMPQATAVTPTPAGFLAQRQANSIFNNGLISKWDWPLVWREFVDYFVDHGGAFLKVGWNPDVYDYVQVGSDFARIAGPDGRPQTLQIPRVELRQVGDVEITAGEPWEFFPDPRCKSVRLSSAVYVQHARPASWEEIEDMFPDADMDRVRASGTDWADWIDYLRIRGGDDCLRGGNTYQVDRDSGLLIETWIKCRPGYPTGARVYTIGKELLGVEPWPLAKSQEYPFFYARHRSQPGMFWGRSIITDLRVPQAVDNIVNSKAVRNIEDFGEQYIAMSDQSKTELSQFDDGHKVILYDGEHEKPAYVAPASMLQHFMPMQQRLELLYNEISQVHEVSRGDTPPGVKSGVAIDSLQQADDMSVLAASFEIEHQVGRMGQMTLAYVAQFYDDDRLMAENLTTAKVQQAGGIQVYKKGDLEGATYVRVEPGSMLSLTRQARMQLVMWLVQSGLTPPGEAGAQLILRLANVGEASGVIDEVLDSYNSELVQLIQKQASQLQAQAQQQQSESSPALSVPFDKAGLSGQIQIGQKAGLQLNPAELAQQQVRDQAAMAAKLAGAGRPGGNNGRQANDSGRRAQPSGAPV